MFEVGKKYINPYSKTIVECMYVGKQIAVLKHCSNGVEYSTVNFHLYKEYKEPRKYERWHNVFESGFGGTQIGTHTFPSKEDALIQAEKYHSRPIGQVLIKWEEEL